MFIRKRISTENVEWGNGTSQRLLTNDDNMGFTLAYTVVFAGTESKLQYRRHLEACFCISGRGRVISEKGEVHNIEAGTMYALNEHDAHTLTAEVGEDMHLISVFNPPLVGGEKHTLGVDGYSQY